MNFPRFPIVIHGSTDPLQCADKLCSRSIGQGDKYKLGSDNKAWCVSCGECAEYELKREIMRNNKN